MQYFFEFREFLKYKNTPSFRRGQVVSLLGFARIRTSWDPE